MPKRPTYISGSSSNPSTTFLETNEWTKVASKMRAKVRKVTSSWNLPSDITLLPNVPLYFIPSPTRLILKDTNPQFTANAIVDVVSKLSCVAEYNESQACALIESTGNVKLLINLYRHEKNQILVELHRLDGDVIEYHSLARAIFHAARKTNQSPQSQTSAIENGREKNSVPLTLKHPPRPTVISNKFKNTLQNEAAVNKTMENIQNLMTKDRTDAVRLGMESLAILTGESTSREQVQLAASKAVLCNDTSWPDIQGMLFGTVMDSCSKHKRSEEKEDSCSDVDDSEFDTQLRLALTIIGNSTNVVCKKMDNSDSFVDLDKFKELLFILYGYVKERTSSSSVESLSTSSHTQTVYQALRCMFYLISLSEELKNEAIDAGVQGVVDDCIGGGCTKHKLLSDISQEIVAILGQKS